MFTVTKEVLESCEALITLEIEEAAIQDAMKKAARKIANENRFPGFRKGKAPYHMILNQIGESALRREAAEMLLETNYSDMLTQAEVEPVGPGNLEDLQLSPLKLKIRVPLAPVVTLRDYSDLRLTPESDEVSDAELESALANLQERYITAEPVARPATYGDQITIAHVEGSANDEIFLHQHDVKLVLDPDDKSMIPGLVEALVGLSADEEKLFHLTLPEDFEAPELRNAEAEFTVHIESVAERIIPPLDDAFASVVGNFETLEELKADLRERMRNHKHEHTHEAYHEALVAELVARAEVRYPEVLVGEELDEMVATLKSRLPQQTGMQWDDFLRLQGQTEDQMRESLRPRAIERLTENLALEEFARQQGITIAEQDLRERYEQLLQYLDLPQRERRRFDMNLVVVQDLHKAMLRERTLAALERLAQGDAGADVAIMAVEEDAPQPELDAAVDA